VFIRNEQLACAIDDEKGGNELTKLGLVMHFDVRKHCVPLYNDKEDWEGEHIEDASEAIGV
jgi:hypothetical protein